VEVSFTWRLYWHLEQQKLDFLLLPEQLNLHGESENHAWAQERLSQLPFPVYVVPSNHDVPGPLADVFDGLRDFPTITIGLAMTTHKFTIPVKWCLERLLG